jgi:predicted dinucleotide-binding enzyme
MAMKVGILGSGDVGRILATGFLKHGHEVMLGSRDPGKLADWAQANPKGRTGTFADVAGFGQMLVLAVKGTAASAALRGAGAANLARKIVIDATNPITDEPPVDGVLKSFADPNESQMERLQREFPDARMVKAFSCVGSNLMVNPQFKGGKPTMFICGNDAEAKRSVTSVLDQFGFETADMGKALAARAIEPLAVLWCIPGFLHNQWNHAFKLLRQ